MNIGMSEVNVDPTVFFRAYHDIFNSGKNKKALKTLVKSSASPCIKGFAAMCQYLLHIQDAMGKKF